MAADPAGEPAHHGADVIRVLLVDDQDMVRAGFRMILDGEQDIEVVGEVADGDRVVTAVLEHRPDLVLMDVQMPRVDGISATRELGALPIDDGPAVLILTTFERDDYVEEALRAGASGFLLKNAPPEDLIHAIRVVANGDALLAPSITRRMIERMVASPRGVEPSPALDRLTERELEVLRQLARGASNAEIAHDMIISETTVKTHVSNVLAKLHLRDRVQAVVFAYEHGIVRPGQT